MPTIDNVKWIRILNIAPHLVAAGSDNLRVCSYHLNPSKVELTEKILDNVTLKDAKFTVSEPEKSLSTLLFPTVPQLQIPMQKGHDMLKKVNGQVFLRKILRNSIISIFAGEYS